MGHAEDGLGPYNLDTEASPHGSQDQLVVKPIKTWKGFIWDTWELPKDQRWLLFKVDAFILTFASVGTQFSHHGNYTSVLTKCCLARILSEEPRSIQRQQRLSQRDGGRLGNVRQPARDKYFHLDSWLCHWADTIQSTTDKSLPALGHTFGA